MTRRSSHGSDFGSDIGSGIAGGMVALAILAVWLFIRITVYIIQTYVKYHKVSKALRRSLYAFLLLSLLGGVLSVIFHNQDVATSLSGLGYMVLFLTCVVVRRHFAETFMVGDGGSLTDAILHRSWFADESTPLAA